MIWGFDKNEVCVKIGESFSRFLTVNKSIPQGSILGGILFLLYINDLPKVSSKLSSVLFADDTTLLCSNSNYETLIREFNGELSLISEWLVKNRLSLNVSKTVAMLFTNRLNQINTEIDIVINNVSVVFSTEAKY